MWYISCIFQLFVLFFWLQSIFQRNISLDLVTKGQNYKRWKCCKMFNSIGGNIYCFLFFIFNGIYLFYSRRTNFGDEPHEIILFSVNFECLYLRCLNPGWKGFFCLYYSTLCYLNVIVFFYVMNHMFRSISLFFVISQTLLVEKFYCLSSSLFDEWDIFGTCLAFTFWSFHCFCSCKLNYSFGLLLSMSSLILLDKYDCICLYNCLIHSETYKMKGNAIDANF